MMMRPTINWGSPWAEVMMIAPTIMMEEPVKMVFRRPRRFPIHMHDIAPKKQPTLYDATAIPHEWSAYSLLKRATEAFYPES